MFCYTASTVGSIRLQIWTVTAFSFFVHSALESGVLRYAARSAITQTMTVSCSVRGAASGEKWLSNPRSLSTLILAKSINESRNLTLLENRNRTSGRKLLWRLSFSGFLASLPFAKTLKSATAQDIIKFLVWKDKGGRTKVHTVTCSHMGQGQGSSCKCPCRLAAGTVNSLIGKLRAIFISAGMGGEWDDNLGTGNPASHRSVKAYLQAVKEEQAKARVRPKKATPLFLDKLQQISQFIVGSMRKLDNSPIDLYLLGRDLCFFSVDFFAGDRSSDLGRTLGKELLYFPDKSGILFNHTFGKTLRGDALNTFSIRRCENWISARYTISSGTCLFVNS